jgi:superfamily I DNA and/or RNA helicase
LSNPNRINVAISRAKNNLVVFANSKIMNEITCWSFLMQKSVQNVKIQ